MNKVGLFGLILFFSFTLFVISGFFAVFDYNATVRLQNLLGDRSIFILSIFSLLGTVEVVTIFLLLFNFIQTKLNKVYVLLFYALTIGIELGGKYLIHQKGPPFYFLKTYKLFNLPSDLVPKEFFSYPSGHSARSAFISGLILIVIWKSGISKSRKIALGSLVVIFDALMFSSRIYLGEHWTTDVVGGLILGYSLALLVPLITKKRG